MDHTPAEDIQWEDAGDEHFTGRVRFGPLSKVPDPGLNALGVLFEPGARTDWHTHPEGQVLYIASGAGKVQKDDGETVHVSAGDVVSLPGRRDPLARRLREQLPDAPVTHHRRPDRVAPTQGDGRGV